MTTSTLPQADDADSNRLTETWAANLSRDDVTLPPFMAKPSDPRAARLNLLIARAKSLRAETPLTTIPPRAARP